MGRKLIWLPALRRWQDGFYEEIAQICKLDSASSILPIFWLQFTCFCVPSFQNLFVFKGGPEPLEKESHEFLGSKRDDRFSNPFFEIVPKTCQGSFFVPASE